MKPLLKLFSFSLLVACGQLFVSGCRDVNQNVNMTVTSEAADGLDLKSVTALLKTVKDPAELEERINSGNPRICNLDLNEDDIVDYVKVTEYGTDTVKGFSLTTELAEGDIQELATIEITKDANGGHRVQTHGNSQIYGNHHYYHGGFGVGDYFMMRYLFSSHRMYGSPYGYNRYPSHYNRSRPLARSDYQSRMKGMDTSKVASAKAPAFKGTNSSPHKSRTSSRIKAPLRNPTASQKSFQARNPSRSVKSGGFGSSKNSSSSGSFRSSSRSGSSFGGGK